jgi:hypothetical protein
VPTLHLFLSFLCVVIKESAKGNAIERQHAPQRKLCMIDTFCLPFHEAFLPFSLCFPSKLVDNLCLLLSPPSPLLLLPARASLSIITIQSVVDRGHYEVSPILRASVQRRQYSCSCLFFLFSLCSNHVFTVEHLFLFFLQWCAEATRTGR